MRAIFNGRREKVQSLTENVMKISRKGAKEEKQGRTLCLPLRLCAFAGELTAYVEQDRDVVTDINFME